MKLHIFNPEHDIALAHNDKYFTAPRAGRRLREDCGFLPALWADNGDFVLVSDVDKAEECIASAPIMRRNINFITLSDLHKLPYGITIDPWGWDSALCFQLKKNGISVNNLPGESTLDNIRKVSNRKFASGILTELRKDLSNYSISTVGKSAYLTDIKKLSNYISGTDGVILKEPWSSSGRGVRHVDNVIDEPTSNWINNIISKQGGIMVEPFYTKVCDFGMEFISDTEGVHYHGLSIFNTTNGFYEGNLIVSESRKEEILAKYLSSSELNVISSCIEKILSKNLRNMYIGPLGVDMMIVDTDDGYKLHPMVEINMRRTMGHVAIDIACRLQYEKSVMYIKSDGRSYQLVLKSLPSSF